MVIPQPLLDLTTRRVLTMEWVTGVKLTTLEVRLGWLGLENHWCLQSLRGPCCVDLKPATQHARVPVLSFLLGAFALPNRCQDAKDSAF